MKGKEKNQLKSQKGITLIALVITIIILLILAGVTINIVIHNGIMDKSQTAVDKYSKEQVKESLNLAILNYKMGQITGEGKTFEEIIAEIGGTATHNEADKTYTVILDGYEFTIDDSTFEIKESKEGETSGGTETPEIPKVTEYTITVEENENVTVTGGGKVEKGQSITISATVASGYVFNRWTITSGIGTIADEKSASTTVTPTSNITIKAIVGKTKVIENGDNTEISEESTNVTITGGDFDYTNPVIPVGFKTSDEGASWEDANNDGIVDGWNDGLVIEDVQGNQFVWVPAQIIEEGKTGITGVVEYKKWCTTHVSYTEVVDDKTLPEGITSENTQINTYGGFYIGRYEASQGVNNVPQTQFDKEPWVKTTHAEARNYAETYQTGNFVKSGLLTGTMWDTTLAWIDTSESGYSTSTSYGNYSYYVLNTGKTASDCVKNIYDLAGNVEERILEYCTSGWVMRGGAKKNGYPPSHRAGITEADSSIFSLGGFRVALYVI